MKSYIVVSKEWKKIYLFSTPNDLVNLVERIMSSLENCLYERRIEIQNENEINFYQLNESKAMRKNPKNYYENNRERNLIKTNYLFIY